MKKKRHIFLGIGAIIVIVIATIAYLVVRDLKQEELLKQEIINLTNKDLLHDDYTIKVVTTGDYGYIEEAIKKYYKQLSNQIKLLNTTLDQEELITILSIDNLENDRPTFQKSDQLLTTTKTKLSESFEKISNLCEEKTIKDLIDKEKVDDYYLDLYQELMYTKEDLATLKQIQTEMATINENLNLFLDKIQEILNFLEQTNDSWVIEENQLYFSEDSQVAEYNRLYNELTKISQEKLSNEPNFKTNQHTNNQI